VTASLITDELRDMVGREATYTAPEPLGRAAIRYFALAVGDDNPVYTDDEAARAHGYDGVVAPPTLVCETNQFVGLPRDDNGFAGHAFEVEVPGTRQVRGGNSYRFHRPVRPDDVVTVTWRVTDVAERTTGSGARMVVLTSTATFTDAEGALLVENEETLVYLETGVWG
jgi:acyl dehydratase